MDERTRAVFEAFQTGQLSRRQFIQRLAALGFAGSTISLLLAACGNSESPSPTAAAATPTVKLATSNLIPTPAPIATSAPAPMTSTSATSATAPATNAAAASVTNTNTSANANAGAASDPGILKSPDPNPKRGGTLTLAFGVTSAAGYDIQQGATVSVFCHLYNNLIRLNLVDGLKTIVPDVAQKWEMTPDGLTYTFTLRSGVQFHDGSPLSSADVAATYNRMIFPPMGVVSLLKDRFPFVAKIEPLDPLTVKFTLSQPSGIFLLLLSQYEMAIYSKKTLDANNNDLRKVLVAPGTGPFMFKSYKEGESWTFVKNPNYWNKDLPYIDTMQLIHVPAWSDRGTAVLTGQADLSWNVSKETWDEGVKHPDTIKTNRIANFGAYQVIINTKMKPFDDPRVRRAMNLALDKQGLITAYGTQEQIEVSRWVPHGGEFATPPSKIAMLPGYRADKTQDIADAKKLLADAGFPNGIPGVELLAAAGPQAEILAPAIQDQLKRVLNIDTKIRVEERSLLVVDEKMGKFTLVLDTPADPIADFSPLGNLYFKTGASQNYGGYSNPMFDALLKQSDAEIDPTKRGAMIEQMQNLLDQDPPWLFLGYTDHLPMWKAYVKGTALEKRAFQEWGRIETVWLDK